MSDLHSTSGMQRSLHDGELEEVQTTIAVRGHLVPDAQALAHRRANRHRRRGVRASGSDGPKDDPAQVGTWTDEAAPDQQELQALTGILGPRPWYTLTFDTEVVTDLTQALRAGYYEVRGLSLKQALRYFRQGALTPDRRHTVIEAGFVVGPKDHWPNDHATVRTYAAEKSWRQGYKSIPVRTAAEFVTNVFYPWVYDRGARLVGHNLFFDLTRFATTWGPGARGFRGGFWLKLCACPHRHCAKHPAIRCLKLGRFKMRYAFRAVSYGRKGQRRAIRRQRARFLDTMTFGMALAHPKGASLRAMGEAFGARVLKIKAPEFDGPITEELLGYLRGDVLATYWLAVAEGELYQKHGLVRAPETIYSEASLGKGYFDALGVPRARARPWHLDPEIAGYAMTSYFGGRTEVHLRLVPVEVMYCDFKSQYPTINALMGLQAFWIAQQVTVQDVTEQLRSWLTARTPEQLQAELQRPETWRKLCVLVNIQPMGQDILPTRARYNGSTYTIGQQYLHSDTPLWYTLADVLASIIRTGHIPPILYAYELVPSGARVNTEVKVLFGEEEYRIDLTQGDFFTQVIDLRSEVKDQAERARQAGDQQEFERLDALQTALKLLANATSYGIFVEVNEKEYGGRALPIDVYALGTKRRRGNVVEEPGSYFLGALGAFIPAGGRLLLALAEQLAVKQGMTYAMCDTDSMAFARPTGWTREEFQTRVREIASWFTPLSPYAGQPPLFELEDVNWALDPDNPNRVRRDTLEPLYFLGVSAKRYILFNQSQLDDGSITICIRKFSSHGLGLWGRRDQDTYSLPAFVPPPHPWRLDGDKHRIPDSAPLGGPLWVYKLWYDAVFAFVHSHYPDERPLYVHDGAPLYVPSRDAWLDAPAYYQLTISTWADYQRFKHVPGMRPGNFITVMPGTATSVTGVCAVPGTLSRDDDREREDMATDDDEAIAALATDPSARYTHYCSSVEEVRRAAEEGRIFSVADHQPLPPGTPVVTMWEALRSYFMHPEEKAANGHTAGEMRRRHIFVERVDVIGKESNRLAQASAQETNGVIGAQLQHGAYEYGPTGQRLRHDADVRTVPEPESARTLNLASLFSYSLPDLMAASCLSRRTIERVIHGSTELLPETLQALEEGLVLLGSEHAESIAGWRDTLSADQLATHLAVDITAAREMYQGRRRWSEAERAQLIAYMSYVHRQGAA